MLLPIGSERTSDIISWMTILLIVICVAVHILNPPSAAEERLSNYCHTPLGETTFQDLKANHLISEFFSCSDLAQDIVTGDMQAKVAAANLPTTEKGDLLRALTRSQKQIDFFSWSYEPKRASFIKIIKATFAHGDWFHLIGNMIFLWIFGRILEDSVGPFALFGLFLGSSLFSDAIYTLAYAVGLSPGLPTLGASAGIYGVMAGVWRRDPKVKVHVMFWLMGFFKNFQIPAIVLIGFYVSGDFIKLITGGSTGVNLIGHLSGFAFVYLLLQSESRERLVQANESPHRYDISPRQQMDL